jgi:hypothetical protein
MTNTPQAARARFPSHGIRTRPTNPCLKSTAGLAAARARMTPGCAVPVNHCFRRRMIRESRRTRQQGRNRNDRADTYPAISRIDGWT